MTDKIEGPDGPKKGRATATKEGVGWHVEFDEAFIKEMEDMDPEERKQIEAIVEGLKNGTVDPLTMGIRSCGYCGNAMTDEDPKSEGTNMCLECAKDLA
jgi:hypothetical protein